MGPEAGPVENLWFKGKARFTGSHIFHSVVSLHSFQMPSFQWKRMF